MFKKYYIESKLRFSIFVIIMLMIIIGSMSLILGTTKTYADGKGNSSASYYAVTVESGDTLWTIACKYSDDNKDIRKFIYEIYQVNKLESSDITVGQQLLIPA